MSLDADHIKRELGIAAQQETIDTAISSYLLGDLNDNEFSRILRHAGLDEWEIEAMIHEFNTEGM